MNRITAPTPTLRHAPSHSPPDVRFAPGGELANFLGWFSIGLGLAEVLAHRPLARWLGVEDQPTLFTALGIREIITGVGILGENRPAGWLWGRVAGDAMDLAVLAAAYNRADEVGRKRIRTAIAAVAGVTALDVLGSLQLSAAVATTPE